MNLFLLAAAQAAAAPVLPQKVLVFLGIGIVIWYKPVSRIAAWLQVPYVLWLCFALYLNLTAYQLNG